MNYKRNIIFSFFITVALIINISCTNNNIGKIKSDINQNNTLSSDETGKISVGVNQNLSGKIYSTNNNEINISDISKNEIKIFKKFNENNVIEILDYKEEEDKGSIFLLSKSLDNYNNQELVLMTPNNETLLIKVSDIRRKEHLNNSYIIAKASLGDAEKIIFALEPNDNQGNKESLIYLFNAKTKELKLLTKINKGAVESLLVSENKNIFIVQYLQNVGNDAKLNSYIIKFNLTTKEKLLFDTGVEIKWLDKGNSIIYFNSLNDEKQSINVYTYNINDNQKTMITSVNSFYNFAVHPNGKYLLFYSVLDPQQETRIFNLEENRFESLKLASIYELRSFSNGNIDLNNIVWGR